MELLRQLAFDIVGLKLRPANASGSRRETTSGGAPNLDSMTHLRDRDCLLTLGAQLQTDGEHGEFFQLLVQQAWKAFHSRRPLWLVRGRWRQSLQVLHLSMSIG